MSTLALHDVCKIYPGHHFAVKNFNLEVKDGEFIIFVGPSGCGKSTTLRMIAGLEDISRGELWIDGELMNYVEPRERNLSMVFQNYALYPNMTVYKNLAYALKIRKVPKPQIEKRVHTVARILEIDHLLDRYPNALSGGQKQRVAIGSAIIRNPKMFLMDEPLSNLDAKLRAQMRVELGKLHKELGTTIIYVTHDQTEAMTLGTRIVVMKEGEIQQVDTPQALYQHPVNKFVAGFIGSPAMNFLTADLYTLRENPGAQALFKKHNYYKRKVIMGIRPEDIYTKEDLADHPEVEVGKPVAVQITAREMLGVEVILYFDLDGTQFCARTSPKNDYQVGHIRNLYFDRRKMHFFDPDTEEVLN